MIDRQKLAKQLLVAGGPAAEFSGKLFDKGSRTCANQPASQLRTLFHSLTHSLAARLPTQSVGRRPLPNLSSVLQYAASALSVSADGRTDFEGGITRHSAGVLRVLPSLDRRQAGRSYSRAPTTRVLFRTHSRQLFPCNPMILHALPVTHMPQISTAIDRQTIKFLPYSPNDRPSRSGVRVDRLGVRKPPIS